MKLKINFTMIIVEIKKYKNIKFLYFNVLIF